MGCICDTLSFFTLTDTEIGTLTSYTHYYNRIIIFLNNAKTSKIKLFKDHQNYIELFEKIKRLEGKAVTLTISGTHVVNIEEFTNEDYIGTIKYIVGLSEETNESAYYEIIFENPKIDHMFLISDELYKSHSEILEIGNKYKITYEFFQPKCYKVIAIEKDNSKNGYISL